jgi:hypothetical protein
MTKISAASLVGAATGTMQMPTGEVGDLAISVDQIKDFSLTTVPPLGVVYLPLFGGSMSLTQALFIDGGQNIDIGQSTQYKDFFRYYGDLNSADGPPSQHLTRP